MEQVEQQTLETIVQKEAWTVDDHSALLKQLFRTHDAPRKFRKILAGMEAGCTDLRGSSALKIGIARYMLCRFDEALEALNNATDNKHRRFFQGLCYKHLRRYDFATEEFERARDRGWEDTEVEVHLIEMKALSGKPDEAAKALAKAKGKIGKTADFHYLQGLVRELSGDGNPAEAYEQARSIDEAHLGATFRLAYYYDLHGEEDQAVELYRQCISRPPVHANALLNLAILYEDAGKYDKAIACLRRILTSNPRHARARLFLKDADAAQTMYYDEDQARRIAHRNAVLDIPVTDFELSVRARNCLKKMNIRTLGDLVRTTESELLGYKNFGETSLREIKEMLTSKALHLGQALEQEDEFLTPALAPSPQDEQGGILSTPIGQLGVSVRVRRALETLDIQTLGDLAAKTEAELMACKNFGQTSLNEVRQRLGEHGLQLREAKSLSQ
ncbi:MAG: DNA-directed RNA polymerase subunit alpha C-terminal domain-containing protein [Planctomycetota bacterium]|nr:DNA-directed RNA polymerase subunit alpha C-terminal domain-containing protein [Planctomycetota bacterium]